MQKPILIDQNEFPEDDVLSRYLGENKNNWDSFINILKEEYPLFSTEWRYYKDGKSWLFKVTKKKKTICWVSVYENLFKTTFYFTEKVIELLRDSQLQKEYLDQFINGKMYGKIKGITVDVRKASDLETTKILIGIKEKMK